VIYPNPNPNPNPKFTRHDLLTRFKQVINLSDALCSL